MWQPYYAVLFLGRVKGGQPHYHAAQPAIYSSVLIRSYKGS